MDCIFCKINNKELPAYTVYEDDMMHAFLDINPISNGHLVLIPKEHHVDMIETPDELISALYIKSKELMKVLKKAMGSDLVVVSVVGEEVPHFHIKLIPRDRTDILEGKWEVKQYADGEADQVLKKIKAEL